MSWTTGAKLRTWTMPVGAVEEDGRRKPAITFKQNEDLRTRDDENEDDRKRGPSEDYGNDEHTTVAAFLPWRGL